MAIHTWLAKNQTTIDTARSRDLHGRRISYRGAPTPVGHTQHMVLGLISAHLKERPGSTVAEISVALHWPLRATKKYLTDLRFPFVVGKCAATGKGCQYQYYQHGGMPS